MENMNNLTESAKAVLRQAEEGIAVPILEDELLEYMGAFEEDALSSLEDE